MDISTDEKSKEALYQSEVIDKSSERPPSYSADQVEQPPLELPQLDLSSHLSSSTTVTRDQCVAHLKFLAVLADLRDTISSDDGLFGIHDAVAEEFQRSPDRMNEARARIREKRWAVYTARAVDRYTTWWADGLPRSRPMATINDLESEGYENILVCDTIVAWDTDNLPPLDILMVWHAHCLNPRNFLEDCIRYGKMSTWVTGFPWEVIDRCINNHTMEYTVSEQGQRLFEQKLNIKWNNLHDPPTKQVNCPCCGRVNDVPWTKPFLGTLSEPFRFNQGYADDSFTEICVGCLHVIDHGRLKVAKFRKDLEATLYENLPMPGSFTNLQGIPEGSSTETNHGALRDMLFPTRILQVAGRDLMDFTDGRVDRCQTVAELRNQIDVTLWNKKILKQTHGAYIDTLRRGEDLVGAVIRQGTFVDKMDQIDWLHSPTVFDTMGRLIKKYEVFFRIMLENPHNIAVPTLDVDLAWHTHQLSPSRYYKYSTSNVPFGSKRTFIDHDDKVDEGKTLRRLCLDQQNATRAPDLYNRLIPVGSISRARTAADRLHDRRDISSDPKKNPHISSHNAVRPDDTYKYQHRPMKDKRSIQRTRLKSDYEKAVRRAEKRRQRSDSKSSDNKSDPYYTPYAFGYPIVMPFYAPYMMDPSINCHSYANNPSCMGTGLGDVGNCCAGTCGKFLHILLGVPAQEAVWVEDVVSLFVNLDLQ
ncbi:hypothetical protein N7519_002272 [Penicillium mononematosum]|uniref:uncharacterized protein n=1 Tax=Penicillium mononematosum TaxID=268346 RepID=UPI002547D8EE|nr:uncharacterized protein N7519_002272 [Penicillium mononematosum]KAJ6187364.1 hypothetical protein N7519_002272 [Penicillium mononematosum]